jgi:hypothetical protein
MVHGTYDIEMVRVLFSAIASHLFSSPENHPLSDVLHFQYNKHNSTPLDTQLNVLIIARTVSFSYPTRRPEGVGSKWHRHLSVVRQLQLQTQYY